MFFTILTFHTPDLKKNTNQTNNKIIKILALKSQQNNRNLGFENLLAVMLVEYKIRYIIIHAFMYDKHTFFILQEKNVPNDL